MNLDVQLLTQSPLIDEHNTSREDIRADFCCQTIHKPLVIVKQRQPEPRVPQKTSEKATMEHSRSESRVRINPTFALIGQQKLKKSKEIIMKEPRLNIIKALSKSRPTTAARTRNQNQKSDPASKYARNICSEVTSPNILTKKNTYQNTSLPDNNEDPLVKQNLAHLVSSALFLTSAKNKEEINPRMSKRFTSTERLRPTTINRHNPNLLTPQINLLTRSKINSIINSGVNCPSTIPIMAPQQRPISHLRARSIGNITQRTKIHKLELSKRENVVKRPHLKKDFVMQTVGLLPAKSMKTMDQGKIKEKPNTQTLHLTKSWNKTTQHMAMLNSRMIDRQIVKINEFSSNLEFYLNKKHSFKQTLVCPVIIPFATRMLILTPKAVLNLKDKEIISLNLSEPIPRPKYFLSSLGSRNNSNIGPITAGRTPTNNKERSFEFSFPVTQNSKYKERRYKSVIPESHMREPLVLQDLRAKYSNSHLIRYSNNDKGEERGRLRHEKHNLVPTKSKLRNNTKQSNNDQKCNKSGVRECMDEKLINISNIYTNKSKSWIQQALRPILKEKGNKQGGIFREENLMSYRTTKSRNLDGDEVSNWVNSEIALNKSRENEYKRNENKSFEEHMNTILSNNTITRNNRTCVLTKIMNRRKGKHRKIVLSTANEEVESSNSSDSESQIYQPESRIIPIHRKHESVTNTHNNIYNNNNNNNIYKKTCHTGKDHLNVYSNRICVHLPNISGGSEYNSMNLTKQMSNAEVQVNQDSIYNNSFIKEENVKMEHSNVMFRKDSFLTRKLRENRLSRKGNGGDNKYIVNKGGFEETIINAVNNLKVMKFYDHPNEYNIQNPLFGYSLMKKLRKNRLEKSKDAIRVIY